MGDQKRGRRTESEMQKVLEEWHGVSGIESRESFCARHGLPIATFLYWHKRLRTQREDALGSAGKTPGFTRVERPKVGGDCFVRIESADGRRAELMEAVSWSYLKGLLSW